MIEEFTAVAAACAALIGLTLGMLGGGGAILTVPAFVYVIGFTAKPAIAMTLPVIGITSLVGALAHLKAGNIDLKAVAYFGAVTMVGAFIGGKVSIFVPGTVQLVMLGCVMVAAAVMMYRSGKMSSPVDSERAPTYKLIAVGLLVGLLTGIIGIGGGFMIVPSLVLLAKIDMRKAVGTSLLIIAFTTTAGYLGTSSTVDVPWRFLIFFTAVAVCGTLIGARLSRHVSVQTLKKGFALLILLIGLSMLAQNLYSVAR